jgi:hypothetical protein
VGGPSLYLRNTSHGKGTILLNV